MTKTKFTASTPSTENTLESISLLLRSDPSFRRFETWRLPVIASIQTRSRYLTFERVRGLTKFAGFQSNTLRNAGTTRIPQLSPVDRTSLERLYFSPTSVLLSLPRTFDRLFFDTISFSPFLSLNPYLIDAIVLAHIDISRTDFLHSFRDILSRQFPRWIFKRLGYCYSFFGVPPLLKKILFW